MTVSSIKNAKGERKYYEGFGTYKTASEWAKALNMPRMTVWQYLQQGMTPEEIQLKRDIKVVNLETPKRKQRIGHRQRETQELVEDLLDFSGYDPDGLEVRTGSGAFRHKIYWNDTNIGGYDPSRDILCLSGGDELKLAKPVYPDMKIYHIKGIWYITPETKQAVVSSMLRLNQE